MQIAAHTSCCLPSTEDIRPVFVFSNQKVLHRRASRETSEGRLSANQAMWFKVEGGYGWAGGIL